MDEIARAGRATREAIGTIDPEGLRLEMDSVVERGSMLPGALTLVAARSVGGDPETVTERAAGVQLVYAGLGLIRDLAREDPWAGNVTVDDGGAVSVSGDDLEENDVAMLAADVLVARGFSLLARTDASGKAVETVRSFGRDQTLARSEADGERPAANLEADCLELAVVAGTTGAGADPTPDQFAAARRTAREAGAPLPPVDTVLADLDLDDGAEPLVEAGGPDGAAWTSGTDP